MKIVVLSALIVSASLALVSVSAVSADGPNDYDRNSNWGKTEVDTHVESRPDGVYIQITVRQTIPGGEDSNHSGPPPVQSGTERQPTSAFAPAASTAQGRSWTDDDGIHYETLDGHVTTLRLLPNIKAGIADGWVSQIAQRPGEFPYLLITDSQFQGVIWIGTGSPADIHFGAPPAPAPPAAPAPAAGRGTIDPYAIALQVLGQVPLPNIQVKANPALGLVALPGWFWVDGYEGQRFGASRTVTLPPPPGGRCPCPKITVSVEVWADHYEWSFGDGTTVVTHSLGRRYPQESDIQHTYEFSSLQYANGFPVRLTVEFAAEFRVDGGPAQALPPIRRTYEAGYRIQEVQAILAGR